MPCTTLFTDGNLDVGGVIYDGCYSASHAGNALAASDKSVNRDWPHCFPPASAWTTEVVSITDDVFGADVGGIYCFDLNGDFDCEPDDGELVQPFCGQTTIQFVPGYAVAFVYLVDGPELQPVHCPGTANPVGGTTGTIDIWLTPTNAPQCADGIDNDGDGYTDWGYGAGWPSPFCLGPQDNQEGVAKVKIRIKIKWGTFEFEGEFEGVINDVLKSIKDVFSGILDLFRGRK